MCIELHSLLIEQDLGAIESIAKERFLHPFRLPFQENNALLNSFAQLC